jgi:CRP/FNR family transcriptional regulator, anaerobic regulatory protein
MLAMTLPQEIEASHLRPKASSEIHGLDNWLRRTAPKVMQAREHVFFEGDSISNVYQVEQGTVCLYKTLQDGRRQIIDFAHPGDFIGLGTGGDHVFSAQAITLTRLRCLPAGALLEVACHNPEIGMQLYRALSDQLLAARDLLLTVGQRNAVERLAALLLALSRRNERNGANNSRIALSMTRADIADFLSLTVETVSRTFTKLRQSGIIDLAHSSLVVIKDRHALEQLAAGEAASGIL